MNRVQWMRAGVVALVSMIGIAVAAEPRIDQSAGWKTWLGNRMREPTAKQFPRFAWAYFGYYGEVPLADDLSTYAGAGFTDVQVRLAPSLIKAAQDAGLKPILGTWEGSLKTDQDLQRLIEITASKASDAMLLVKDEPALDDALKIGKAHMRLLGEARLKPLLLTTVLPSYASNARRKDRFDPAKDCALVTSYCDFVEKIILTAKPNVVLATLYPDLSAYKERERYHNDLEHIRRLSQEAGIGMFGFVLVTPHLDRWRGLQYSRPGSVELGYQVWSLLAHGAKGIAYYAWRTKLADFKRPPGNFHDGIVDVNGAPTEIFDTVRRLNCQLAAIGPALLKTEPIDGDRPFPRDGDDTAISTSKNLKKLQIRSQGALVTEFHRDSMGYVHFIAVNTRIVPPESAKVIFKGDRNMTVELVDSDRACALSVQPLLARDGAVELSLEPGMGRLIRIRQ